jgi:hypothetical protein
MMSPPWGMQEFFNHNQGSGIGNQESKVRLRFFLIPDY